MKAKKTQPASKLVWWIARLASLRVPYNGKIPKPKVGDIVVEVTHIAGLAKHQLGLHSAIGELLEIGEDEHKSPKYLIKSFDSNVGNTWWSNAYIAVVWEKQ